MKFPYDDISAPDYIYVNPVCWQNPYHGASPLFNSLKYHRSDTVTPNDVVREMMRDCVEMSVYRDVDTDAVVEEVLSRYVSSDSD